VKSGENFYLSLCSPEVTAETKFQEFLVLIHDRADVAKLFEMEELEIQSS
jgi:hypothetical protein